MQQTEIEKLVIVGSGPAGLTAAIYAARGHLNPLVISGRSAGGQLILTTDVDDFPGFENGIQGPELMTKMRQQAERFDTRFINEDVVSVDFSAKPYKITTETQTITTESLIIATGASAKWLGLKSEYDLIGRGVSACAVCDGLFFKDKNVIVVGGGDTAMREAQHLAKVCAKVTMVHRRSEFRAQAALVDLIKSKGNIDYLMNSEITEFIGENKIESVKVRNVKTGEITDTPIEGVFVAIGHNPSTDFLKGQIEIDDKGYILVTDDVKTSVDGVFAAGDVVDQQYRQAVTAAGNGCQAAMQVEQYLETLK